jgi:uncharacterized protein (DUF433 family)
MQLEDFFDFNTEPVEHIRIKGTRIDIGFVIDLHKAGQTPEQIAARYHTVELVQVYAAITYYLQNKYEIEAYLTRREQTAEAFRREIESRQPPSDAVKRILAIKAAREAAEAEQT